jgi:hypothetical protein
VFGAGQGITVDIGAWRGVVAILRRGACGHRRQRLWSQTQQYAVWYQHATHGTYMQWLLALQRQQQWSWHQQQGSWFNTFLGGVPPGDHQRLPEGATLLIRSQGALQASVGMQLHTTHQGVWLTAAPTPSAGQAC